VKGLARNLDVLSELQSDGPNREPLRNHIFPLELGPSDAEELRTVEPDPAAGAKVRAALLHVAEGTDASARRELRMLQRQDLLRKGVSIVHGIGLLPEQLQVLAEKGVGLVWSLRSNLELYGRTADVVAAKNAKITMAIAPDWSPTGSAGMLPELRLVNTYNRGALGNAFAELDLVSMATRNPAALAGLAEQLGTIAVGLRADLLVMRRADSGTPLTAALRSTPPDVRLVIVGGKALYGDPELMRPLAGPGGLEPVSVCGAAKVLAMTGGGEGQGFAQTERLLQKATASVGTTLSPLAECP
jgi:5-methylthioadenosine/S-adenosylhomocysteine deaminase